MRVAPQRGDDSPRPEALLALQRAVRTLRAIRERYEVGRNVDGRYVRAYSVQVALGHADMLWVSAAIVALERGLGAGGNGAG